MEGLHIIILLFWTPPPLYCMGHMGHHLPLSSLLFIFSLALMREIKFIKFNTKNTTNWQRYIKCKLHITLLFWTPPPSNHHILWIIIITFLFLSLSHFMYFIFASSSSFYFSLHSSCHMWWGNFGNHDIHHHKWVFLEKI